MKAKKRLGFLIVWQTGTAWLLAACQISSAQTSPIFNVMNYGATGNGTTLDSPAINAAIAAAGTAGGGTVTFPPGTYLCGSIHLTNCPADLTLYLSNNAVIWASATNIDQHESSPYAGYQDDGHTWFQDALIWGEYLNHFTIAGPG
ncbi:MAG TPA: glycosyl hydrolase family 28-related protein, partial [Verrucomicrobiae bacterium]|nr:glycosyl hydrolase family 28-related protein [Verrucomicrobiae bacterium]